MSFVLHFYILDNRFFSGYIKSKCKGMLLELAIFFYFLRFLRRYTPRKMGVI